ncbi:uncharacterized protein PHACADRAFT_251488 [Phanerochaete carnosa HHB-10118-sp]|uniref:WSC domain-containing protein n=1 Tax=Phanerochaete carnosa (strain HHB-10118-sp) TaxID=650164 RepID=K5W1G4_PHACS|nr:uncharacterized protein PHACADRAFT_251488 [Phanerochaete carnosa HHB-10118-sp]EKM57698.1 hypothetical protein PHACADRAFT_251488 [Phanerochaete carnosa HHB-10118-sp]
MVAGSPTRDTYNASNFADQAISFVCLDYSGTVSNNPAYAQRQDINFPDINMCQDGIRLQVFFPQCWDGVNLDSSDHKSHMAYPVDTYDGGHCPESHPVHTVAIFYEQIVPVSNFNYWGQGAYALSTGDPTGLTYHADFLMGWNQSVLQDSVDNCHNMNGDITLCQVLVPYINEDAASACTLDAQVVDEDVGLGDQISALPGCNPVRTDFSTEASCPNSVTPGFFNPVATLTPGWTDVGCIAEGTNGRALTGASTTSPNMTVNFCAGFCGSKGYTYAGVEFGDECYCGSSFSNGANGSVTNWYDCSTPCAGNPEYEKCGGPQRLELLKAGGAPVSISSSAAPNSTPVPVLSSSAVPLPASSSAVSLPASSSAIPTSQILAAPTPSSVTASVSAVPASASSAAPASGSSSGSWASAGCVQDGPSRALTGYSFTSSSMTTATCQSTCAQKGFTMAGIEYGDECYCGNSFENGLGQQVTTGPACYMTCNGAPNENCGGSWTLSLYTLNGAAPASSASTSSAPAPAASVPANNSASGSSSASGTWTSAGCVQDGSARALTGYSFTSSSLTTAMCQTTCAQKGFTMAGIEYGDECYCGDSFQNGLGQQVTTGPACYMTCSGAPKEKCGGSWTLSLYTLNGSSAAKRSTKRSKHFGRHHQLRSHF